MLCIRARLLVGPLRLNKDLGFRVCVRTPLAKSEDTQDCVLVEARRAGRLTSAQPGRAGLSIRMIPSAVGAALSLTEWAARLPRLAVGLSRHMFFDRADPDFLLRTASYYHVCGSP